MRKIVLTLALAATSIAAAACSAQSAPTDTPRGPGHRGAAMMMHADANHDGVITRAEAMAEADARFAKLDTDGDGQVTAAEMQARRSAMRDRMQARGKAPRAGGPDGARMGRRGDVDGDGLMTKADAEARAAKRFDRMDANHDGKLDKTELANFNEMRRVKHREMRNGGDMPPPADDNGQ